ncbi:MAG: hypothetical protein RLZZ09_1553 [Pseudomonadota bacterium]|jgi:uncharacterized lipoprotein NlpE involved in copper resistance
MKKHLLIALTLALGGCVNKDLRPHDWAMDVQTAETREAHNSLADHYEEIAQTMDADAAEERRMLDNYITSPHKYGKQIQDIKGRSNAMIRDFEMAAAESRKMAAYHRQLANAASKP